MAKTVNKLRKTNCDAESTYKYRELEAGAITAQINQQGVKTWGNPTYYTPLTQVLSAVPFFDPANPGVLSTTDMTSGTYGKSIKIDSVTSTIKLINNYQIPADATVYLCTVKNDTNFSAHGAWDNSVSDESNLTQEEDLGQYPTDYSLVNNLWKLKRVFSGVIKPGVTKTFSNTVRDICYDPSDTAAQTDVYQKRYKSFQYLIVLKGVIGHDSVATQYSTMLAALDLHGHNTYVLKYDANGAKIDRVFVSNLQDTAFTNGGVISNKPANAQQTFTI